MEALSPTMEEGRLVEWKKQPGDAVAVGDILAEVETDKAVMELLARAAGTLLQHAVPAGTTVPVGQALAYIGAAGEVVAAGSQAAGSQAAGSQAAGGQAAAANGREKAPAGPVAVSAAPAPSAEGRLKASPLARRIAADRGLDLQAVTGTGPEGRIVLRDVETAGAGTAVNREQGTGPPRQPLFPVPRSLFPQFRREPASGMFP